MLTSEMAKVINDLNPNYDFEPAMGNDYNAIGYVHLNGPHTIKIPKGWSLSDGVISKSTDSFVLMSL